MKIARLLTTLIFLFLFSDSMANHLMGAEITYRNLSYRKYEVTLKMYRDCRANVINNPGAFSVICASGGTARAITHNKVSIRDLTPRCSNNANPCYPANQFNGALEGIEEHTFVGNIDFTTSPLSSDAAGGCCEFKIFFEECCRVTTTTTGNPDAFYVAATINICRAPDNSSPVFTNIPYVFVCCNQPTTFNMGGIDTSYRNRDSLVYQLDTPRYNASGYFNYTTGFNALLPFTPYYPASWSNPYNSNPSNNPPIGIYLNSQTGDMVFTPTNCNETGPFVIRVTEYRKDSTGSYKKIAEVRRDMQLIIKSCPANNPPTFNSVSYPTNICAGTTVCFNFGTDDQQYILPPPQTTLPPDTTFIRMSYVPRGGSFSIIDSSAIKKTGRFCWTPDTSFVRPNPYLFTAIVEDNRCNPRPASTSKAFVIKVSPPKRLSMSITSLGCGRYRLHGTHLDSGLTGYSWSIRDSANGTTLASSFSSTSKRTDTVQFNKNGRFIISLSAPNDQFCTNTEEDTIKVNNIPIPTIGNGKDTAVCRFAQITLPTIVSGGKAPFTYNWKVGSITVGNSSSYSFTADTTFDLNLHLTDSNGCTTITPFNVKLPPRVQISNDTAVCDGDSGYFFVTGFWNNFLWSNGSTSSSTKFTKHGPVSITVLNTKGCAEHDTAFLTIHSIPKPALGPDTAICIEDSIPLNASPGAAFLWGTGETSSIKYAFQPGMYKVKVWNSYGCLGEDSIKVSKLNKPTPLIGGDSKVCDGDTIRLDVGSGYTYYSWSSGDTGRYAFITTGGIYTATIKDQKGCLGSISKIIIRDSLPPKPVITGDSVICGNDSVRLDAGPGFTSYNWNNGQTSRAIWVNNGGLVSVIVKDNKGCNGRNKKTVIADSVQAVSIDIKRIANRRYKFTPSDSAGLVFTYYFPTGPVGTTSPEYIFSDTGLFNICVKRMRILSGCADSICYSVHATNSGYPLSDKKSLSIIPNPFTGQFVLGLDLNTSTALTVQIHNALGELIFAQITDKKDPGKSSVTLGEGLKAGIYFISVSGDGFHYREKVIKSE